jgi:hypothetical protein
MKTIAFVILAMALPFAARGQEDKKSATEPAKDKISYYRIAVKQGHDVEFKAALAAHAQQFHKGDWSWRVGSVMSGPDAGMYHITEGPFSWTTLDGRSDLGAEHMKDFETNIAPHVEKSTGDTYLSYQKALSTVPAAQWSDKVVVQRYTVKLGHGAAAAEWMKSWKPVSEKTGANIVVWRTMNSGEDMFIVSWRLKEGWKDLDQSLQWQKVTDEIFGAGEYAKRAQSLPEHFEKLVHEMIEFKPELSSKPST